VHVFSQRPGKSNSIVIAIEIGLRYPIDLTAVLDPVLRRATELSSPPLLSSALLCSSLFESSSSRWKEALIVLPPPAEEDDPMRRIPAAQ
jgi:hypothetical protein